MCYRGCMTCQGCGCRCRPATPQHLQCSCTAARVLRAASRYNWETLTTWTTSRGWRRCWPGWRRRTPPSASAIRTPRCWRRAVSTSCSVPDLCIPVVSSHRKTVNWEYSFYLFALWASSTHQYITTTLLEWNMCDYVLFLLFWASVLFPSLTKQVLYQRSSSKVVMAWRCPKGRNYSSLAYKLGLDMVKAILIIL